MDNYLFHLKLVPSRPRLLANFHQIQNQGSHQEKEATDRTQFLSLDPKQELTKKLNFLSKTKLELFLIAFLAPNIFPLSYKAR